MKLDPRHERWLQEHGFSVIANFRHEVVIQNVWGKTLKMTRYDLDQLAPKPTLASRIKGWMKGGAA